MTPTPIRTSQVNDQGVIVAFVTRTTCASGVPLQVEDASVIERVVVMLRGGDNDGRAT